MDFGHFQADLRDADLPPDQQALIQAILETHPTDAPGFGSGSDGIPIEKTFSRSHWAVSVVPHPPITGQDSRRGGDPVAGLLRGEQRSLQEFIAQVVPRTGRYFSVIGDLPQAGIYEDSLDRLGPVLELILTRMRQNRYSSDQIESALRAGLLARLVLLWSRQARQPLRDLVAPRSSVVEFL